MKCSKCGRQWDVSNKITSSTYVCPYCGETVDKYGHSKKDLGKVILDIKQDYGDEVLEDTIRLNALLMDYAPDMAKERKLVINAMKEGLLTQIKRGIEESEEVETVIRKCTSMLVAEMWITEAAAQYAATVAVVAMGYSTLNISNADDENPESSSVIKQLVKGDGTFETVVRESDLQEYDSIGYKAFAANKQLKEISIPDCIKKIYPKAFIDCTSLQKVNISKGITDIGRGAFYGCVGLRELNIESNPNYTVSNGSLIDKNNKVMLRHVNTDEKTVSIINGVKQIHKRAIESSCVETITIPKTVELIEEDAFYLTMSLQKIDVEGSNKTYRSIDGVLHSRNGEELLRYPQGKKEVAYYLEDVVKKIGRKAFSCATSLTAITFAGELKEIGENAFEYCIGIENIMMPRSVETIGERAFQYCEKLISVMLPQGIIRIGDCAFLGCKMLKTVSVPRSVKEIGNMAFEGCKSLSKVVIQENVSFIGDKAFDDCPDVEVSIKGNEYVTTYCRIHGLKYTTV